MDDSVDMADMRERHDVDVSSSGGATPSPAMYLSNSSGSSQSLLPAAGAGYRATSPYSKHTPLHHSPLAAVPTGPSSATTLSSSSTGGSSSIREPSHQYAASVALDGRKYSAPSFGDMAPSSAAASSGMHRSRSSSVQLHVSPLIANAIGPSSLNQHARGSPNGVHAGVNGLDASSSLLSGGAMSPATAEKGFASGLTLDANNFVRYTDQELQGALPGTPSPYHLSIDRATEPMRSPSLTKPFVRNPHIPQAATAGSVTEPLLCGGAARHSIDLGNPKRRGIVYAIAIVGGCLTFIILLVVLLASASSSLGGINSTGSNRGDVYSASKVRSTASANALARSDGKAGALAALSQNTLQRMSDLFGDYLPWLSNYNPQNLLGGGFTSSAILFGHLAPGVHTLHPILPILRNARAKHDQMMSRQSMTYAQACATYRKRYRRDPPPGFDKWWSFARARNHTMVDEYDSMMADITRFSELTGDQLRARTRTLASLPGVSLISIREGQAQIHSKSGKWAPALALQEMMNAFVSTLPDMEIAINEKQEGRVLPGRWKEVNMEEWGDEDFPLEVEALENVTDPLAARVAAGTFKSDWRRDGSVWEAYRRACPPDSAARRLVESVRSAETSTNSRQMRLGVASAAKQQQSDVRYLSSLSRRRAESSGALPRTRELTFVNDMDVSLDLCNSPSMHTIHSAFFSDTRSIQYLYPLFSPSKPNGFADLLIPFHQYWSPPSEITYENEYRKGRSKVPADMDWDEKDDKIYWRGKVTRGADTPAGHQSAFQKPRLVMLANEDGSTWVGREGDPNRRRVKPKVPPHRVLVTVNATSSSLVSMSAPGPKINEHTTDVGLACDAQLGECAEQQRLGYRIVQPGPMNEAWRHRYVLDLDEVGLSPRFPALMESRSAVIKASMQREFWQDWIVPWYHYIPLSSSYAELFNIQAFFSGFPKVFQNRRSTAASSPQVDQSSDSVVDAVITPVGEGMESPDEVTLRSEAISLKPVNPSHGDLFSGSAALRDIADSGSAWRSEHMRREDMEVYVFRLLLEYARLLGNKPAVQAAREAESRR